MSDIDIRFDPLFAAMHALSRSIADASDVFARLAPELKAMMATDPIKRPESFQGVNAGDILYVGALPGGRREVYRQTPDGAITDVSGVTDAVEPIDGGFRIGGRKVAGQNRLTSERWSAECTADSESTETMMRGRVR